jgi:ankyrin repeat protein
VSFWLYAGPNSPTSLSIHKPAAASAERNAILKAIISHPELSVYALNAAMDCAMGATPLALACRLGRVEQVTILLECPSVLVNTRDASGLTPLMRTPLSIPQRTARSHFILPTFN